MTIDDGGARHWRDGEVTEHRQLINIYTQRFQFIIEFPFLLIFLFVVHLRRFGIRACVSVSYGSVGGAAAAAHAVQVMPISPLIVAIYKIKIKWKRLDATLNWRVFFFYCFAFEWLSMLHTTGDAGHERQRQRVECGVWRGRGSSKMCNKELNSGDQH